MMLRRKLIALWVFFLIILMASMNIQPIDLSQNLYTYITSNFYSDTGSINAVTAIYLDYRVFDTLFETLLLLVSVIGIIYFSRHKGDY